MTIEYGFPGFQSKLASPLSMFHVGDAEGEPFLILTELLPPQPVCATWPELCWVFPSLPAASSHFSEMVMGDYPETSLKKFHLMGTARAQE